jgi:hypothetical protein
MEYNKIIAVTGLPGLYELLSSKSDGAIVRSLDDKTTRFVSSRIHNFSHLESIEVYTIRDNVNLVDILKAMESSSEKLPEEKDGSGLKGYFSKVYPDLDFDRVYSSDLKKMVKWFSVLKANDIEIKLSEAEPEEESDDEQPEHEQLADEKPKAKKPAVTASAAAPAAASARAAAPASAGAEKKAEKKESKDEQPPAAEKPKAKKPAAAASATATEAAPAASATAKKKAEKKESKDEQPPAAEKPKKAAKKK